MSKSRNHCCTISKCVRLPAVGSTSILTYTPVLEVRSVTLGQLLFCLHTGVVKFPAWRGKYSVGFSREAFTDDYLAKLLLSIGGFIAGNLMQSDAGSASVPVKETGS